MAGTTPPRRGDEAADAGKAADAEVAAKTSDELRRRAHGHMDELRRQAEQRLDMPGAAAAAAAAAASLASDDMAAVVHDLQVHQIELEMQNEELRRTQVELNAQHEKYFERFDMAPVGYLVLDDGGVVRDANLTAAHLLGAERHGLVGRPLSAFVFSPDQDTLYLLMSALRKSGQGQSGELRLHRLAAGAPAPAPFWALLEARPKHAGDGTPAGAWMAFTDVDERRRAEAALRASEAVRDVAERVAQVGSWHWDVATRISTWSDGMYRLFDVDPGEPVGDATPILDARVHPDDRAAVDEATARATAGEPAPVEYRVIWRDGSEHILHGEGALERDAAGAVTAITGYYQDVTEWRHAQRAVRESESSLRAILDATPFPIALVDERDDVIDYWSSSALALFGHTAPTAAEWYQLAYPDPGYQQEVMDRWKPAVEAARASGEAVNAGEYRVTCRDGSVRICELHAAFIADRLVVTFNDITERNRVQDELRESEEGFRTLAEVVPQIVWTTDPDGKNTYFNQQWVDYTGMTLEESYGDGWNTPFHPDDRQRAWDAWQRATHDDVAYSVECRLRRADGEYRWWLVRGAPLRDASGKILKWFGTCTDIDDLKQAEEEIRHLNEQLEERVVSRTAQLEAANKELEAFAYSVSHDLRAPLRAIDGFSQMVLEDAGEKLSEADVEHLARVRAGAQRMALLIDALLGLSRVSRQDMAVEEVDMSAMASSVLDELREEQPERQVESVVAPGMKAEADAALLRVILVNLLSNAWKFTSKHETARIEVGAVDAGGEQAFFVRDDGAGFDPAYASHLFGAFQRMHQAGLFEGDGIGLATVQRLVTRHGGRVWAEAAVEQGATFYFTLSPAAGSIA